MWVLKLQKSPDKTIIGAIAKKYGVSFSGYPISHHPEGDRIIVRVAGFVEGSQEQVTSFLAALRKESFILHVAQSNNFAITTLSLHPLVAVLYDPRIIFVQPARYGRDGTELLEVACQEKEPLMTVVRIYKEKFNCTVLSFTQRKISNIGFISVHPDLTDKQRQALQLAVRHGYYSCPRQITLEALAKIMGVSFSTYQAHLAKAEAKFIPEMAGRFL